jgi:hypothetical protein
MAKSEVVIQPYESVTDGGNKFVFGMTSAELAGVDKRVYHVLRDCAGGWALERRGGYGTELVDGKLAAVAFPLSNCDSVTAGGEDFSNIESIERLKSRYEHYVYADGESVLFPALGAAYLVTPFREGWEAPRPGVFNREAVAFARERLTHYRNLSRVLTPDPLKGVNIAGGTPIAFGMTREQVAEAWGEPELLWDESGGAHEHIVEYRFARGIWLCYRNGKNWPLHSISVTERDGWQVEAEGIRIFQDDKLAQMKEKYAFIESKKKKAVAFPSLGLLTVGCGEKKNSGKGADGKYTVLYGRKAVEGSSAFRFIDVYD